MKNRLSFNCVSKNMALPPINVDLSAININLNNILEFQAIKRKTRQLMIILGKKPTTELEELILSDEDDDQSTGANHKLITNTKELYSHLLAEIQNQNAEVRHMWENIQTMWMDMKNKEEFDLLYTTARTGIYDQLKNLTKELNKAQEDRKDNIAEFVSLIRDDLSKVWNQCMLSDEEKEQFTPFTSIEFTEDLLQLHQQELSKWMEFHKKNIQIFAKLEKRKDLWQRMKELQAKLDDPNKYVNRGATLLNNQRDYNIISAKIPQLETKLKELVAAFEKENGRKLLIRGQEVYKIFELDWNEFKSKKNRRQTTRPQPINVNSSSSSLRTAEKRLGGSKVNISSAKRGKFHDDVGEQENHLH